MTASRLKPGDAAPDFTVKDDQDETVSLAGLKGQAFILYFYPRDDTPGCTKEAIEFSALVEELAAKGVTVFGVSKDTVAKHQKFRDKHDLKVRLLADDADLCERYGVWVEKSMYGKKYMGIERSTFLIDSKGKIAQAWYKVRPGGHAAQVLKEVSSAA